MQEYNAQWDYYAGMTPEEIEEQLKQDVCWQRPTWKLGERAPDPSVFADPFDMKEQIFGHSKEENFKADKPSSSDPVLNAAAQILEVHFPLNLDEIKTNYKRLAKIYHPDSHGGDKKLEERFKDVTEAYRLIISVLNARKED